MMNYLKKGGWVDLTFGYYSLYHPLNLPSVDYDWKNILTIYGYQQTPEQLKANCNTYYQKVIMGRPWWVRWKTRNQAVPLEEAKKLLAK